MESQSSKKPSSKKENIRRTITQHNPPDKKLVIMTCLGKFNKKSFYEANEDKIKQTALQRNMIPKTECMVLTRKNENDYKKIKSKVITKSSKVAPSGLKMNRLVKDLHIKSQTQSPKNYKKISKAEEEKKHEKHI